MIEAAACVVLVAFAIAVMQRNRWMFIEMAAGVVALAAVLALILWRLDVRRERETFQQQVQEGQP